MGFVLAYDISQEYVPDQDRGVVVNAFSVKEIEISKAEKNGSGVKISREDFSTISSKSTWYIAALAIISSITALFSIFQFKNRLNQMKLGALNSLFMVATLGLSFYQYYQADKLYPETTAEPQLGFYLPVAAMLLNMIANRFIRKDEKLVKSVDRIR